MVVTWRADVYRNKVRSWGETVDGGEKKKEEDSTATVETERN